MPKCIHCNSDRVMRISGKTNDMFSAYYKDKDYSGYVLSDIGVGSGGDYIDFSYCAECGKIQQQFPISDKEIEASIEREEI